MLVWLRRADQAPSRYVAALSPSVYNRRMTRRANLPDRVTSLVILALAECGRLAEKTFSREGAAAAVLVRAPDLDSFACD